MKKYNGFNYDARIVMASGKLKRIFRIIPGQHVLGEKTRGSVSKLYAARVNKVFNNGSARDWFKVVTDTSKLVVCQLHKFWSLDANGYVMVKNLKIGEALTYVERPAILIDFKPVKSIVREVVKLKSYRAFKFDLETDSFNYFAEGLLVHNSDIMRSK